MTRSNSTARLPTVTERVSLCRRVTVMLATYNEASCIAAAITNIALSAKELASQGIELQLKLVDDLSPDGTSQIALAAARDNGLLISVSSAPRAGLGRAYLRGLAEIVEERWADVIVTLDADGQHDPLMIPMLVDQYQQRDLDLLIGSRWTEGGVVEGLTLGRRMLSRCGNAMFAGFTGVRGVRDATTSYRVFGVDFAEEFNANSLSVSGYSFFSSFVGIAWASGFRIGEFPITFHPRTSGVSKLSSKDIVQFARNLPALRRRMKDIAASKTKPD